METFNLQRRTEITEVWHLLDTKRGQNVKVHKNLQKVWKWIEKYTILTSLAKNCTDNIIMCFMGKNEK